MEIQVNLSFFLMTLLSVLQLKELLNYYYPIEIDSSRPVEEKIPLMVEWCVYCCDGDKHSVSQWSVY